jgi:lipopolysaccharide export system permease protein
VNPLAVLVRRARSRLDLTGRSRPFPRQQGNRIKREVVIQVALVLLLIESIFVAEQLISGLLEEVLKIGASLGKTLALMAAMLPQVFELALPTAILIAVYRVSLSLREDREFLMLSSLGIPPHGLIRLVIRIGIIAQIAAIAVGGFIDPLSRYGWSCSRPSTMRWRAARSPPTG